MGRLVCDAFYTCDSVRDPIRGDTAARGPGKSGRFGRPQYHRSLPRDIAAMNSASPRLSVPKDKLKFVLLEGIHDSAEQVLRQDGYTNVVRHRGALSGQELASFRARLAELQKIEPGAALATLAPDPTVKEEPVREIDRLESKRIG